MKNRYTDEFRDWAVQQMMPPFRRSLADLAAATGVTTQSLRNWRRLARDRGLIVPGTTNPTDQWTSVDKFNAVMESASLSEVEISQYCRIKGIYPEQLQQWRLACQGANPAITLRPSERKTPEQRRIEELERQLKRTNAERAEAVALLELRKKADAIWGKDKDD
jgi:transposase-like protein